MFVSLPDELICIVFAFLPKKCILDLRCVSKVVKILVDTMYWQHHPFHLPLYGSSEIPSFFSSIRIRRCKFVGKYGVNVRLRGAFSLSNKANFVNVDEFSFDGFSIRDSGLTNPEWMKSRIVEHLYCIGDNDHVNEMPNLRSLKIGRETLAKLKTPLAKLETLFIISVLDPLHGSCGNGPLKLEFERFMPNLRQLRLDSIFLEDGSLDLDLFQNLKSLFLSNIGMLRTISLPKIETLDLSRCYELDHIHNCILLENANITKCDKLTRITNLQRLRKMVVLNCKNSITISGVDHLEDLSSDYSYYDPDHDIEGFAGLLPMLYLSRVPNLKNLKMDAWMNDKPFRQPNIVFDAATEHESQISNISMAAIAFRTEWLIACTHQNLTTLNIKSCTDFDLALFTRFNKLNTLGLHGCKEEVAKLPMLVSLEYLCVEACPFLEKIPPLPNLVGLFLYRIPNICTLPDDLPKLCTLGITNCKGLLQIPVQVLCHLEKFSLLTASNCRSKREENCIHINEFDVQQLRHCQQLTYLEVSCCSKHRRYLYYLPASSLVTLVIRNYGGLKEIRDLGRLSVLKIYDTQVEYVGHLPNLKIFEAVLGTKIQLTIQNLPMVEYVDIVDRNIHLRPMNGIELFSSQPAEDEEEDFL